MLYDTVQYKIIQLNIAYYSAVPYEVGNRKLDSKKISQYKGDRTQGIVEDSIMQCRAVARTFMPYNMFRGLIYVSTRGNVMKLWSILQVKLSLTDYSTLQYNRIQYDVLSD